MIYSIIMMMMIKSSPATVIICMGARIYQQRAVCMGAGVHQQFNKGVDRLVKQALLESTHCLSG